MCCDTRSHTNKGFRSDVVEQQSAFAASHNMRMCSPVYRVSAHLRLLSSVYMIFILAPELGSFVKELIQTPTQCLSECCLPAVAHLAAVSHKHTQKWSCQDEALIELLSKPLMM